MTITVGDCVEGMAQLEASSIDAVCTDPPYHLGFMGRTWDRVPTPAESQSEHYRWAVEALRVLKPGGYLVAFGGTRTYHRLACALEDAGFEIRDCLSWMYGSGFPKSHGVAKAIDAAAGAEGEWRQEDHPGRPGVRTRDTSNIGQTNHATDENPDGLRHVYEPVTDEAKRWQGWGTALKPAWEPIILARKPLAGTVAANVLAHGTGGINIEATRVDASGRPHRVDHATDTPGKNTYGSGGPGGGSHADGATDVGRWPANVVLAHDPDCQLIGTELVEANGHFPGPQESRPYEHFPTAGFTGNTPAPERRIDEELVERWACTPECPVRMLDDQATPRMHAPGNRRPSPRPEEYNATSYALGGRGDRPATAADLEGGGPSRFFYCAKASRAERNAGLEGLPEVANPGYQPKAQRCRVCGCTSVNASALDAGVPRMTCGHPDSEIEFVAPGREPTAQNHHPTVKPIGVMRWLARLVTPPGGTILDPFTGSGTTGIAAALEGFSFHGFEQKPDYAMIAERRIAFWREHGEAAVEVVRRREAAERRREAIAETGQLDLLA